MKKFIFTLMIALVLPIWNADARKKDVSEMTDLISQYRDNEEFECISVGGVLLSLVKGMVKSEAKGDEDALAVLSLMRGIKHITIADFSDCAPGVKESFRNDASKVLKSLELLIEAKDDDSRMSIYSGSSTDGKTINGLVLYAPDDDAVICIDCKISVDELGALMSQID